MSNSDAVRSDAEAIEQALRLRVAAARLDFPTFAELVLRDEATGKPLELAPMHEDWSGLLDASARLVLHSGIEHGKTALIGVGRTLWELGRNPGLRAAIISATHSQATKVARAISGYIERSAELRAVFPDLVPDAPWSPDAGRMTVRRPHVSRDPSVQALGVGAELLGARLDLAILDDCLSYESTRTAEQRARIVEWFRAVLLGRMVEGGRVWLLGTAWHPDDLLHVLVREGWRHERFGVEDGQGNPRWPARWSPQRIAEKRAELGVFEASRSLDCFAVTDDASRFRREWIDHALAAGKGKQLLHSILVKPAQYRVIIGVDLAAGQTRRHDESALVAVLLHPDRRRQLLAIEHGRWAGPETLKRIASMARCFDADSVVVESNGIQLLVRDLLSAELSCPVHKFATGARGYNLGFEVERLAAELERGEWLFPSDEQVGPPSQVRRVIAGLLSYDPRGHTDDVVVALALARHGCERATRQIQFFHVDMLRR